TLPFSRIQLHVFDNSARRNCPQVKIVHNSRLSVLQLYASDSDGRARLLFDAELDQKRLATFYRYQIEATRLAMEPHDALDRLLGLERLDISLNFLSITAVECIETSTKSSSGRSVRYGSLSRSDCSKQQYGQE